jgi:hypothetical protein
MVPGLQFIHVDRTHFEIRISLPGMEEALVVGRPEIRRIVHPTDSEVERALLLKFQPPTAKIVVDPEIDLPDSDIDRVLALWKEGKSAAGMFGVRAIPRTAPPQGGGWPAR